MNRKLILVMYLLIQSIYSLPIRLLLPLQYGMQQQAPFLRQMLPGTINSPVVMYPQQPVMILLPQIPTSFEDKDIYKNMNEQIQEDLNSNTGYIDKDSDSVVLDAEPNNMANGITKTQFSSNTVENNFRRAVLLSRNQERFSIGNIISYIPFLPIEVNVPDSISWIYDLITSIGNRNPFRPQTQQPSDSVKRISNKGPMMPIMVMPLGEGMLPMQF